MSVWPVHTTVFMCKGSVSASVFWHATGIHSCVQMCESMPASAGVWSVYTTACLWVQACHGRLHGDVAWMHKSVQTCEYLQGRTGVRHVDTTAGLPVNSPTLDVATVSLFSTFRNKAPSWNPLFSPRPQPCTALAPLAHQTAGSGQPPTPVRISRGARQQLSQLG